MHKLPYVLLGTGFLILAIALVGWFVLPNFVPNRLPDEYKSGGLGLWNSHKEIKTKGYLKIYLFNVKNPADVINGQKPVLEEIGPYVYQETRKRITLGISADNDTATYKDHVQYHFRPDLSDGSEMDVVTIINLPWVGLAQEMAVMSTISRLLVMGIVSRYNESIFMTRPVGELLFGGYYHHIIATFASITGETYMPNNTFGLFYGRNDTNSEEREVSLGQKNLLDFGNTLKWKGLTEMEWWKEDKNCSKIRGSDWTLFAPGLTKDSTVGVFDENMCRHLKFEFNRPTDFGGIPGYRFTIPKSELQNPRVNSENRCYCTDPGEADANCPRDGVYQINACSKGASILLSLPHFLDGSPEYEIQGLHPDPAFHETFIDLEPVTGQVLQSSKRIQVNLHLKPLRSVSEFRKVPNMIFPVMWTDEATELMEPELSHLRSQVTATASLIKLGSSAVAAAGFVFLLIGSIVFLVRLCKKDYSV